MKIKSKESFDLRDAFDVRLEALNKSAPEHEIAAAVNTYERLRTALAITSALQTESSGDNALLISVFEELCAKAHALAITED